MDGTYYPITHHVQRGGSDNPSAPVGLRNWSRGRVLQDLGRLCALHPLHHLHVSSYHCYLRIGTDVLAGR